MKSSTPYSFNTSAPVIVTLAWATYPVFRWHEQTAIPQPDTRTPDGPVLADHGHLANETPATGYEVTLVLPHNGLSDPKACKYLGGSVWDCARLWFDASTVTEAALPASTEWAVESR